MVIFIFLAAHWYLSLFTQTFFLHRYAAHQMFTMSKSWEKFFYVLSFVFQGSSFLSPRAYGIMHRLHHAYADTENDPHSPKYSDNLFDMMWKTKKIYNNILKNKANIDPKFMKNIPNWDFMERLGDTWMVRIAWGTFYSLFYIQFATSWWMFSFTAYSFLYGARSWCRRQLVCP